MTRRNPGKHGIFGFTSYADQDEEQAQLISSLHVKDETLWQILSSHGKRVGVMNVPVTYPPKKVNGFLISGL
jgi:predicted AlkP superfamily phosphohydrolase/phosphomutase